MPPLDESPENSRESLIRSINRKKLAKELGAKPRDFSETKNTIKRILGKRGGEIGLDTNIFCYPLFVEKLNINTLAIFANIIEIGYRRKIEFLQEVTEENIESKLSKKRDLWIKYFCTTLRMEDTFSPKTAERIKLLREQLEWEEKRFITILNRGKSRLVNKYKDILSQEGLPAETIFSNRTAAFDKPEINIPYIDEILCYYDSRIFLDLVQDIVSKETRMSFGLWISARSDFLADITTETYKLFCHIFSLGEVGLFEQDGQISHRALENIPEYLHGPLDIVERKRKQSLEEREKEHQRQTQELERKKHVQNILTQTPHCTYHTNYVLEPKSIPPGIKSLEITVQRNGKTYARTTIAPPFQGNIDLKTCLFQTFNPDKFGQEWNTIAQWKGGDNYVITAAGKIGKERTLEQEVHSWKQEKERKENLDSFTIPTVLRVLKVLTPELPATKKERAIQPSFPVTASGVTTDSKPLAKNKKEEEKEELRAALEIFLEKSDEELQSFFLDHHVWDEEKHTLTLSIPVEELEEMGYVPNEELGAEERASMLQWTAKQENTRWDIPENTPQKIKNNFSIIFHALSQKIERGEIDNQLSVIGLPPSDTDNNSALRTAVRIEENIDIKKLLAQIVKISNDYTKNGTPFNLYNGGLQKDNIPDSISLLSKGNWLATLTLRPSIEIKLGTIKNKPLPLNATLLAQRIENALLNFIYQYLKNGEGISNIVRRTSVQEDTKKLRESYRRDLKKKTARLLIENPDGTTFTIIGGISTEGLEEAIKEAQVQYGVEKVALLYRKNTYAFLGDTSIYKPSQKRSDDDYTSLNLSERRNIIKERILKTLFNGKSGIQDRTPFLYNSAVYHALHFEVKAFQDKVGRNITPEDISDAFLEEFIDILRSRQVLISYRDYCAGWVEDLTELDGEQRSPE